jgi:hypothetical protein
LPRKTWIFTGSPENFEVTRERGFTLIGMKERRGFAGSVVDAELLVRRMRAAVGVGA